MQKIAAALVVALSLAAPHASAAERYATDRPSPLKRLKPFNDDNPVVPFNGQVGLTGQFVVIWERDGDRRKYLQVTFFPDINSSALLPRPARSGPVKELYFSNVDHAAPMLLDLASAQKSLSPPQLGSEGFATIVIRDYEIVTQCDQRFYLAKLISAKKTPDLIASARDVKVGC